MAGVRITYNCDDREVRQALERLRSAGGNLEPVLEDVGEYLLQSVEARFSAEKDPEGKPWAPLNPRYARRKRGPKILTEDHHLRRIHKAVSGDELEVGTNRIYGATHQLGRWGSAGRSGGQYSVIPPRPYLGINADDEREIGEIFEDHIRLALDG